MDNRLIVVENGCLKEYRLDEKREWLLGRVSSKNFPDIEIHSETVSRQHGVFKNINGVWFYIDKYSKNGTVHNNQFARPGIGGRIKPIMLDSGDVFIFGGGEKPVINSRVAWAMFVSGMHDAEWRVCDTEGQSTIGLQFDGHITELKKPQKGTVIHGDDGYAIYMGDVLFLNGNIEYKTR